MRAAPAGQPSDCPLTDVELRIVSLASEGMTNALIGKFVERSENTIKTHLRRINVKLGTSDRAHVVSTALRKGWID